MRRRSFLASVSAGLSSTISGCGSSELFDSRDASVAWKHASNELIDYRIADSFVYPLGSERLAAVSRTDGSVEWSRDVSEQWGTEFDESRIYTYGPAGIVAHRRSSGEKIWRFPGSYQSLHFSDDAVVAYASDGSHNVALDPTTGKRRWKWTGNMLHYLAPNAAFVSGEGITVVDLDSGRPAWTFTAEWNWYRLTADSERFYVAVETDQSQRLYALDLADGAEHWNRPLPGGDGWHGRLLNGTLYATSETEATEEGLIVAFDPETGSVEWQSNVGSEHPDPYPLGTASGTLVLGQSSHSGPLASTSAVDAETGAKQWHFTDHETVAMTDDRIALTSRGGKFRGVGLDGSTRWTAQMAFVPFVGKADGKTFYRPPLLASLGETIVAGFAGTNVISEWRIDSGRRTWELHLETTIRSFRGADDEIYASDGATMYGIHVS